jgi:hypothetical protein
MNKTIAITMILTLVGSSGALAQGCNHGHDRDDCSDRRDNGSAHSRAESGWEGHYEKHTRENSHNSRDDNGWRAQTEPVHTRASSQKDR